jgi:hypothetical protein
MPLCFPRRGRRPAARRVGQSSTGQPARGLSAVIGGQGHGVIGIEAAIHSKTCEVGAPRGQMIHRFPCCAFPCRMQGASQLGVLLPIGGCYVSGWQPVPYCRDKQRHWRWEMQFSGGKLICRHIDSQISKMGLITHGRWGIPSQAICDDSVVTQTLMCWCWRVELTCFIWV